MVFWVNVDVPFMYFFLILFEIYSILHYMKRHQLSSALIASVGYDKERKLLEIEFRHGSVHQYFRVPEVIYEQLLQSKSAGRFYLNSIKDLFDFKRLQGDRV